MSFLLNTHSRTVHRAGSVDKRCHLQRLNPENVLEFPSPEAALCYFTGTAAVKTCPFCMADHKKRPDEEE